VRAARLDHERGASGAAALTCACTLLALVAACSPTVDSLGYDGDTGPPLRPLVGPSRYPNAFRDMLGKTDAEISAKLAAVFAQLFHGDPQTQAIYVPVGTDRGYIQDVLHADVRTEGIGYGMLIALELNQRDELDRLWTYAKTTLRVADGTPAAGYFSSFCDTDAAPVPCLDPFGLQQMLMALILAHDRYTRTMAPAGAVDYQAEARRLLTVMRHKQDQNHGIVAGVTDSFDATALLAFDVPDVKAAGVGRPAIAMPAYYDLWAQATGDPFWTAAAGAARGYWRRAAQPTTGLFPVRATFAGVPVPGSDTFNAEAYRGQLNMVLDRIWVSGDVWTEGEGDRLLAFFAQQGLATYGASFTLDGATTLTSFHEPALVVMNGVTALTASHTDDTLRKAFVDAVWNQDVVTGFTRYYPGLLHLLSLLALSGQLQVY
jgi:oligosaccharide reducing-end xylanase